MIIVTGVINSPPGEWQPHGTDVHTVLVAAPLPPHRLGGLLLLGAAPSLLLVCEGRGTQLPLVVVKCHGGHCAERWVDDKVLGWVAQAL